MSYREKFFEQLKVVLRSAINQHSSECGGKHIFLNQFIVKFDNESLNPSDNYSVSDATYALEKFNEFLSASKIPARFMAWTINEATGPELPGGQGMVRRRAIHPSAFPAYGRNLVFQYGVA